MKNFKVFDYFYYTIGIFFYSASHSGDNKGIAAFTSLFHAMNIGTIFSLIFSDIKSINSTLIFIGLFMTLAIITGIRYEKVNYSDLKEKWERLTVTRKRLLIFSTISYMILSFILFTF